MKHRHAAILLVALLAACAGPGQTPPATTPTGSPATPATSPPATAPAPTPTVGQMVELTLMTHDSFAISDDVWAELEREHGIRVRVLQAGDAGSMVNQAILAADAPLADVLFGVDNSFLSRALEAGIFESYRSSRLDSVPAELQIDPQGRVTPIDFGDVCLNYDRAAFEGELSPPATLEDLVDERYRGMLVVQNPATSSPGLAFLLATASHFGERGDDGGYGWQDYWAELVENDVLVTSGWEEAYYGFFSAASEGDRPIVVSYASSPAAEVFFAAEPMDEPPTGVVTAGCFRQVEFAGILRGTRQRTAAERLIDFMLSPTFQEDIPLNMFVFPANEEAELPEVFAEHAARVEQPLTMAPDEIGQQRERLIGEWTDVVLR